jgi:hypothetical protein
MSMVPANEGDAAHGIPRQEGLAFAPGQDPEARPVAIAGQLAAPAVSAEVDAPRPKRRGTSCLSGANDQKWKR